MLRLGSTGGSPSRRRLKPMTPTAKELRLKQINARFKAVTPRRLRRRWRPSIPAVLIGIMIIGAVGTVLVLPQTHLADPTMRKRSIKDRARHLLASPNCSAAGSSA